ncbi:MAG TPA: rhomboid family intramembrane serine protease [Pontiella sp.]|nr:rhomboid family intramembrane serine protease [Pontiella sp.]
MAAITPAVKFLLILNVSIFLLEAVLRIPLSGLFALPAIWWQSWSFGSLFTYMFVHANSTHLFVNMLGLFFIGPTVEQTIGSYRFFVLYYLSGILGGLGWSLLAAPGSVCVGASGALMGILGAFGTLYPHAKLLLWFILPIKAWVLVTLLVIWELYETVGVHETGGIANAAHLMGAIAGICYAITLKHPNLLDDLKRKRPGRGQSARRSHPGRPAGGSEKLSKEEVDRILDKIGREGMGALSLREREMLKKATRG